MDHGSLVEQLDRLRTRVVPVIGAGLAVGCGAPSSAELANELARAGGVEVPESIDLYEVANEVERRHGRTKVQQWVAEITLTRELTPTPVMLAVTLINRRVIATTNYDDAIEKAARQHGLTPKTLLPIDLPTALQGPGQGELLVLHLHGTAHSPETIVLTDDAYEAARSDEALQLAVRVLAAGSSLVFLGHRLASNETHLRRDVKQAVELFGGGEHLLLHAEGELSEPTTFESETGVRAMAYPNPDRDHRLLVPFARRLGVPPLAAPHAHVPRISAPVEAAYEPMPVGPAAEVETDQQRHVWHYGWLYKRQSPPTVDDLASSPLLLIGRPGTGKTQALLHIAKRSSNAVYLRLGGVTAPITGQDPIDVLVAWVHSAGGSFDDDVPAVTRGTLQDNAYDFLLDGLDEHPASRRGDLIGAAGAMAAAMPQHRWVLASRRVPELTADALVNFDRHELVPTREWMVRYAEQHGVDQAELDNRLQAAPALADLLDVPLFSAATVALIKSGQPIPSSPLDLLLSYASRALNNEETRLGADPVAIDTWLDRLALAMLCAGSDSATTQDVASGSLIGELPPNVTSDLLVTRVLLVESGGELRFPIRPIRDARAIRELCRLSHGGPIFERFGVVRLAGQEHLRPDWQYAVDLLASAGQEWLTRVGRVDPLTAARATSVQHGQSEKLGAAKIILDWYRSHRIHIPRSSEGQLRDDLEAVRLLVKHAELGALVPDLIQDLEDPDPARRANAVGVLSAFGAVDELGPRLSSLLRDGDSVVRRRTAVAITDHNLSSFAAELVDLAIADSDDLSRRTLAGAAVQVADDTAVCGLVLRLPTRLRQQIQLTVDHRMTRSQQLLTIGSAGEVDGEWLQHLAGQEPLDWEAANVEEFCRLWQTAERYHQDTDVLRVMAQHPIDALRGAFNAGGDPSLFDVLPVLKAADPNELDRLAQELGPDAQDLVQDFRAFTARSAGPTTPVPPDPPPFDLAVAVAEGDLGSILANKPSAETISSLNPSARADLEVLIDQAWGDPSTGTSPVLRIRRTGRGQWTAIGSDFQLASLVLRVGRTLTEDEWFKAVELTPHEPHERATLRNAFEPAWEARAIADLPQMDDDVVESLIRALPGPWTRVLTEAVADRAFNTTDQGFHQVAAERIAESGHLDLLTTWATEGPGSAAIDRVLAASGSANAEARLLADLEQRGYPQLEHWGRDSVWINQLSAPSSAKAVETALRVMLRRGDEAHELTPLFRALNRCAGEDAARVYDSMIGDASIPGAPFLWYRKQELIAAQPPELDTVERVTQTIYGINE